MPRNGNSARKPPAESEAPMEINDDEDEEKEKEGDQDQVEGKESESDEEMGDVSDDEDMGEVNDPQELIGSPSPAGKDMKLRSGLRKRRRSKETTGLTPPEGQKESKKARPTTEPKKKRNAETPSVNGDEYPTSKSVARTISGAASASASAAKPKAKSTVPPRSSLARGRASLLSADPEAVARAQDPEIVGSPLPFAHAGSSSSSTRRLFDGKPPLPLESSTSAEDAAVVAAPTELPVVSIPPHEKEEEAESSTTNGYHHHHSSFKETLLSSPILSQGIFWRIFFMIVLAAPLHMILWPVCVAVSDYIIPLEELTIPDDLLKTQVVTEPVNTIELAEEEDPNAVLSGPIAASLAQSLESMSRLQDEASQKLETIQRTRQLIQEAVEEVSRLLNEKAGSERVGHYDQAETLLLSLLVEGRHEGDTGASLTDHDSPTNWHQVRELVQGLGRTILDTPSIELWHMLDDDALQGCGADSGSSNPPVDTKKFNETVRELAELCRNSAKGLMDSPEALEIVRTWIEGEIENSVQGDPQAATILNNLAQAAKQAQRVSSDEDSIVDNELKDGGLNREEIELIVEEKLEMELADRTGQFDFAAIHNGASIIRRGKWATSTSLVDSLPLGNRLLQLSQLQFYGFGPEAAITPTYPQDALGQCWSFQETPIEKMQQQLSQGDTGKDDHRSGNFGTITVRLPTLVRVTSVVIEHPPQGLTDQIDSAIRYFRVVGFEDSEATARSWHLGSFEFDIKSSNTLQEFEVATEMFGRVVPPLHSISLAIDTNWGYDYACLYRFRVHGQEVEIVEDDEEEEE